MTELKIIKKERKKRYKNEIERIEARRNTRRKSEQKRRDRLKLNKQRLQPSFTNQAYRHTICSEIKDLRHSYQATLRFNQHVSIEYAKTAVEYFIKGLKTGLIDYLIAIHYGNDNNPHIHLSFSFTRQFLALYVDTEQIKKHLHSIWNSNNRKNGAVWIRKYKSNKHKQNYFRYIFRQVSPLSSFHKNQKQVDLYHIHTFANNHSKTTTARLSDKANFTALNGLNIKQSTIQVKTRLIGYRELKLLINQYKHMLIPIAFIAIWLLFI